MHLLACQVRVTVGDSDLCCVGVTSFERVAVAEVSAFVVVVVDIPALILILGSTAPCLGIRTKKLCRVPQNRNRLCVLPQLRFRFYVVPQNRYR